MVMKNYEKSYKVYITNRVNALKFKAFEKHKVAPQRCHIGHIALQGMLEAPHTYNQIDAATGEKETNLSVATRSCRLASAMNNYGLKAADAVVLMDRNHLDVAIPFFACHFNGYAICAIDPSAQFSDLQALFPYVRPKMVFCPKSCEEKVKQAYAANKMEGDIVIFDDKAANLESFIQKYKGSETGFVPADFDFSSPAWLMLTSGTTGLPKVAVIPYETLLNGLCRWWKPFTGQVESTLIMATLQWLSSLMFYIGGPIRGFTRVQSSVSLTPQLLIGMINRYKPHVTAWTPYLLGQFLAATDKKACDLSSFKYIAIGGSAIEKSLVDRFRENCNAFLYLVYGATELLVPIFRFTNKTPFGSTGTPFECFQYRIVDEDGHVVDKFYKTGELWVKGDTFFKGYLNNTEETRTTITKDGWIKTGDIFYKDKQNYYYFVERKKLLIRHFGFWISPLQLEEAVKRHASVSEACAVSIPDSQCMELPIVAVSRKVGCSVEPKEIFALLKGVLPKRKHILSIFFVETFPVTPSGKIHRSKVKEMALTAQRIHPDN